MKKSIKDYIPDQDERLTQTLQHYASGAALEICGWGVQGKGVWGRKSPSGVQGQSPGRGSGGRNPPEAEALFEK